ncbi:branched-chain amino acid transport system II carrier protein [Zooshikella harenae]|uniref:Branched-chain amino acid transport system carrier protein n=1 Tax=Zooshikella harenae TaxID=2827238 RepID=A0ABS5ZIJ4_9GAMM|nr:branched-chain amino acid transport system II carrier protein [Zooshikella harenae]MBU2713785.1 branched-chain amino acid transport system II carrier protein [Zooshikella harenae]
MNSKLKSFDIIAVGLMTFALFLGAGNLIFPPSLGQMAGTDLAIAIFGFLLTGVGLPLLGLVAAARMNGGLTELTQDLPFKVSVALGLAIYLIIGPFFASPRTAVVAFEMSVKSISDSSAALPIYSFVYFGATLALALFPGKLVDSIGKIITPLLVLVIAAIALGTVFAPQGPLGTPSETLTAPFSHGFKEGYLTMDALGGLAFGIVIITALRDKGVSERRYLTRYTIYAGLIAALGLSLVYISLGYLGATSQLIASNVTSGGEIIQIYTNAIYGDAGNIILGLTITLACLSTAVGLMTACGEYFHKTFPQLSYRAYVILFTVLSGVIANVGLSQLISLSIPVLFFIYPLAIAIIFLCLMRPRFNRPRIVFSCTLLAILPVSLFEGIKAAEASLVKPMMDVYTSLPLHAQGLAWVVPGVAGLLIGFIISHLMRSDEQVEAAAA